MNEDLLKALYENVGGSKVGTYEEFVAELKNDKEFQNTLYNNIGGENVGTYEEFVSELGFSHTPKNVQPNVTYQTKDGKVKTEDSFSSTTIDWDSGKVDYQPKAPTPIAPKTKKPYNAGTYNWSTPGDERQDAGIVSTDPVNTSLSMLTQAKKSLAEMDIKKMEKFSAPNVYDPTPADNGIDWKAGEVKSKMDTPNIPTYKDQLGAREEVTQFIKVNTDILESSKVLLQKDFGKNWEDDLTGVYQNLNTMSPQIEALSNKVKDKYGDASLPELSGREEIRKRSSFLRNEYDKVYNQFNLFNDKIEYFNNQLGELNKQSQNFNTQQEYDNYLQKFNSIQAQAAQAQQEQRALIPTIEQYKEELQGLYEQDSKLVGEYNAKIGQREAAYKNDPEVKKLDELINKYNDGLKGLDKYRENPLYQDYMTAYNNLEKANNVKTSIFPDDVEFQARKEKMQAIADQANKGLKGKPWTRMIDDITSSAVNWYTGAPTAATGPIGVNLSKAKEWAYNIVGDVVSLTAATTDAVLPESLEIGDRLRWGDWASLYNLDKERQLETARTPSKIQGSWTEDYVEVKSGGKFDKYGLAPGSRIIVDENKNLLTFRDEDGYKTNVILSPESRKQLEKDLESSEAQTDLSFTRGAVSTIPSMLDLASMFVGARAMVPRLKTLGLSTELAGNTAVFGMSFGQMFGDNYSQYVLEGLPADKAALYATAKTSATALVESVVGPLEAKLATRGMNGVAARNYSKLKDTTIDLFARGRISRQEMLQAQARGLGVWAKELGLENGEELIQEVTGNAVDNYALNANKSMTVNGATDIVLSTSLISILPSMGAGVNAYKDAKADIFTTSLYYASQNLDKLSTSIDEAIKEGTTDVAKAAMVENTARYVAEELEMYEGLDKNQSVAISGLAANKKYHEDKASTVSNQKAKEFHKQKAEEIQLKIDEVAAGKLKPTVSEEVKDLISDTTTTEQTPTTTEGVQEPVAEVKTEEPSAEQQLQEVKEGNTVTFTYNSEEKVPDILKDKISSKSEINGVTNIRVTVPKSLAEYLLQTEPEAAPAEQDTTKTADIENKTQTTRKGVEDTFEYNPPEEIREKNGDTILSVLNSKKITPNAEPLITDFGNKVFYEYNNYTDDNTVTRIEFNKNSDGSLSTKGVKVNKSTPSIRDTKFFENKVDEKLKELESQKQPVGATKNSQVGSTTTQGEKVAQNQSTAVTEPNLVDNFEPTNTKGEKITGRVFTKEEDGTWRARKKDKKGNLTAGTKVGTPSVVEQLEVELEKRNTSSSTPAADIDKVNKTQKNEKETNNKTQNKTNNREEGQVGTTVAQKGEKVTTPTTLLEKLGTTEAKIKTQIKKFFTDTIPNITEEQSQKLADANFIMWKAVANTLSPGKALQFMRRKVAQIGIISTEAQAQEMSTRIGGNLKFQIIGEKGAKALDALSNAYNRINNLRVAKKMSKGNYDKLEIKIATGWELGPDNKWRYEIVDDIDFFKDITKELQEFIKDNIEDIKGGGIIDFDSNAFFPENLLSAYPKLSKFSVFLDPLEDVSSGEFDRGLKSFTIGVKNLSETTEGEFINTILHEVQHFIQSQEGFATGGDIGTGKELKSDISERAERLEDYFIDEIDGLFYISDKDGMLMSDGFKNKTSAQKYLDSTKEANDYFRDRLLTLFSKYGENTEEAIYILLQGEVEARNVEFRAGWDEDLRRESLLEDTEDLIDPKSKLIIFEDLKLFSKELKSGKVQLSSDSDPTSLPQVAENIVNNAIEHLESLNKKGLEILRGTNDKESRKQIQQTIQQNKQVIDHLKKMRKDPKFQEDSKFRGVAIRLANGQHIVAALEAPTPLTFLHEIFHSNIEDAFTPEEKQTLIDEYNDVYGDDITEWNTDASEWGARLFERYLSNGRKLTENEVKDEKRRGILQQAFDTFAGLMKELHNAVTEYTNTKGTKKTISLSPQAQAIFDRVTGITSQTNTQSNERQNMQEGLDQNNQEAGRPGQENDQKGVLVSPVEQAAAGLIADPNSAPFIEEGLAAELLNFINRKQLGLPNLKTDCKK